MGVRIALDMFPADITLPSGAQLTPARICIVNDTVQVYVVQNGECKLYYERELVSSGGNHRRGFELQVAEGMVTAVKAGGCGCNHPLKVFNPWPGERRELAAL